MAPLERPATRFSPRRTRLPSSLMSSIANQTGNAARTTKSPYVPISARMRCEAGGPAGMLAASIECGLGGRRAGPERQPAGSGRSAPGRAYAYRRRPMAFRLVGRGLDRLVEHALAVLYAVGAVVG